MNGYLLDENIPQRWPAVSALPLVHARSLGTSLTDGALWTLAQRERWVIVSKDADFAERIIVATPPPWIVHLRIGNMRLAEFRTFVASVWPQVESLLPAHKLVYVYADRIEAVLGGDAHSGE